MKRVPFPKLRQILSKNVPVHCFLPIAERLVLMLVDQHLAATKTLESAR